MLVACLVAAAPAGAATLRVFPAGDFTGESVSYRALTGEKNSLILESQETPTPPVVPEDDCESVTLG